MRTHAKEQNQPQPKASPHPARLTQLTSVNQAAHHEAGQEFSTPTHAAHDFSRIPLYSAAPVRLQLKLAQNVPGDIYEQEAEQVSERVTGASAAQAQHNTLNGESARPRSEHANHRHLQTKRASTNNMGVLSSTPIVNEVLSTPGQPLDPSTRAFMEPRFGHDFSQVRIHTDERAGESAQAVNALAYTVGRHIVFRGGNYSPETVAGKKLLAHELTHVVQQTSSAPALMRQATQTPATTSAQPTDRRTYIIIYGSGQLNPTTGGHHQGSLEGGGNFYLAAKTKRDKLVASLGADASKHNIVFGYTPTEAEVKNFLNKKYDAPVAEVHIFSHGWPGGTNLGGPNPTGARPKTESPTEQEQRWLQKEDLGEFSMEFAEDANVTFYGCNIGNAANASNNIPFAQEVSDAYGIPVTASTTSSHFEHGGGTRQVPDKPGKMQTFTPQRSAIDAEIKKYTQAVKDFADSKLSRQEPKTAANNMWNKITGAAAAHQAVVEQYDKKIAELRASIKKQRAVAEKFISFLPEPDKTKYTNLLPMLDAVIDFFDKTYPD